jgi:CRISPR-associated protein Csx10
MSVVELWRIRPEEPLVLGGVRAGANFLNTLSYVPGRVLRGAWADWLIRQGRAAEIPTRLAEVHIGNFFPVPDWCPVRDAAPLPLSALTCKGTPGFRSEPYPGRRGHGVLDTLIPQLAYTLLLEHGARLDVPFTVACAVCGGRMEPLSGFYCVYQTSKSGLACTRVRARYYVQTKVAIDRRRRAAAEAMLYTVTALSPRLGAPASHTDSTQLAFLGRVQGPPEMLAEVRTAVTGVALGALHGRGFGRVTIEVEHPPVEVPLTERLERFNVVLARLWNDLRRLAANPAQIPDAPDAIYFSLHLLAPGIFRRHGLPSLLPYIKVGAEELAPVFWITRPDFAAGWSSAWGLPKPAELAARAGSVYVFRWDGPRDALLPALIDIETRGIGERRDESFGECRVCHPFHEELTDDEKATSTYSTGSREA